MAGPTIASTTPSSGATGVPTNVSISVTFDQEVDTYRLKNGGIFLEGPDPVKSIGPGFLDLDPPETDENDYLTSPDFKGIKEVDFTFVRVDGSGNTVNYYDYGETGEAGAIYRTKVVITPKAPLAALTEYTVYIVGDEDTSDEYDFGLSSRSVFDPRKGANLGNGEALFYGGYTGSSRQQFFIEITSAGVSGTAEYEWWTDLDVVHRTGTTSITYRPLQEGVSVRFPQGLNYVVGDTFSVWCDIPEFMDGSYKFSFTTSSHAPETLPESSTLITGSSSTTTSALEVEETNPADRQTFVSTSTTSITIDFSADIDSSTVTSSTVAVQGHYADGMVEDVDYTETLTATLSVSGSRLTITLAAGQLYDNNIITVTLDSSIADTDENELGEDYSFFFGTPFSPFYAGVRSVRLRLGSLGNYFPDETIAMAIWEASREAYVLAPTVITGSTLYTMARRQFVICLAAWYLVTGTSAVTGGSTRKRLGDFDVSRSDGGANANGLDDTLLACINKYRDLMMNGGIWPENRPVVAIKGEDDVDEPLFGRGWEAPSIGRAPIANNRVLYYGSRRWYKTNTRMG